MAGLIPHDVPAAIITLISSIIGILVSTGLYVLTTKFAYCGATSTIPEKCWSALKDKKTGASVASPSHKHKAAVNTNTVVILFEVLHGFAHFALFAVNVVCMIKMPDFLPADISARLGDYLGVQYSTNSTRNAFLFAMDSLPYLSLYYETISLYCAVSISLIGMCYNRLCCCICSKGECSFRKLGSMLRFTDLLVCFLLSPLSYTYLMIAGGPWYGAVIVRLILHSVIISSAVVAGMTVYLFCLSALSLPAPELKVALHSEIKIKNYSHLFTMISFKIVPIGIGLFTASSALNTYHTLSYTYNLNSDIKLVYAIITLLKSFMIIVKIIVSTLLLRWHILEVNENVTEEGNEAKKDQLDLQEIRTKKAQDEEAIRTNAPELSITERVMKYLNDKEPHTHIFFVFDFIVYGSLIVLNSYIVHAYPDE